MKTLCDLVKHFGPFVERILVALIFLVSAWTYPPEQVRNQRNHFMKNVTIGGALIFVMGMGAGPLSIDQRRRMRAPRSA